MPAPCLDIGLGSVRQVTGYNKAEHAVSLFF